MTDIDTKKKSRNIPGGEKTAREVLEEKLQDTLVPGFKVPLDPDEADEMGAFEEDAMSLEDAMEASTDPQEAE